MWQELIVGACVLAAAIFWIRKLIPGFAKTKANSAASCDGCSACGTDKSSGGCH